MFLVVGGCGIRNNGVSDAVGGGVVNSGILLR